MEKKKCQYCLGLLNGMPEKCSHCGEPTATLSSASIDARKPAIDRFCDDFLTRHPRYQITVRSYELGYVTAKKEWKTFNALAFIFFCLFGLIPGIIYLVSKQSETRVATLKFRFDAKGNPIYVSDNSQLPVLKRYWKEFAGDVPVSATPFLRHVKFVKRAKVIAVCALIIASIWAMGAHNDAEIARMSAPTPATGSVGLDGHVSSKSVTNAR